MAASKSTRRWWDVEASFYSREPCPSTSPATGRRCQLTVLHRSAHGAAWQNGDWSGDSEWWPLEGPTWR